MTKKTIIAISIAFVIFAIIAIYSFINPRSAAQDFDLCDRNFDGSVDTDEIWDCHHDGQLAPVPLDHENQ
ncbi:hypothetical protein KJ855_02565 [Patescibacteria group bacterium]|nr:hypothetical protein [Patescibacteria group bacterium]